MLAEPGRLPGWVDGLSERTALGRLGEPADGGLARHRPIDAYGQVQRLTAASTGHRPTPRTPT